ncbi:FAD-binding protein [Aliifodinibius sp. S!AR15-10]|uniref:FAD-binding and (Fe-S)-binding domain-containing protein n=1 Tax=Aliifodinibius sp. S!AR15-10 TaxID=2950437 RepID=UPI00285BD72C|nr:FAD-linked oxidase C-terminal domain-containing protein [Aliifodinibius sp. S!AR15-10]MDR8392807.1 FAD-binding protein [Aliifodinibius sp. S!AR15-10]
MPDSLQIKTDSQTRRLYANDASMYEEMPRGVAFPQRPRDIQELVQRANKERFTITPRSAGTSLAGQTTGNGVIMDVSRHMTRILDLDPKGRRARVEPGVIRDTLNREACKHDLIFGPDTATTNRCMLGGMIGNNSCGSFSIKYGTTRDHILEIETILSDGSRAVFKPLSPEELEEKKKLNNLEGDIYRGVLQLIEEHRQKILEAYPHPEIIRRNTGYVLDKLCSMQPFAPDGRPFNMAELLCGSEGTLAMTVSAKVNLEPLDPCKLVMVPHFNSLREAMEATVEIVKYEPAAVELVDSIILDATKGNIEQRKNRFFLDGEPECILIIQLEGQKQNEIEKRATDLKKRLRSNGFGYAHPILTNTDEVNRVWELRKAGLGLLMGLGSSAPSPSFCEDTAVRVQDLPDYVDDFKKLLDKYDTNCVFYAHASVGELHLRPVIDIHTAEGVQKMKDMADDIADLVRSYNGSLSGEHGDGRARAPYIEKVLGKEMIPLLQKVKEIWDPSYIFNPGKIIRAKPIDEDLRVSPTTYRKAEVDTEFNWRKEGSFGEALELCNGAGVCRKLAESGGTMCPSYMATKEEKDTTRGRANLFRQLFSGKQKDAFKSKELKDALDLCLSCKACKSECPANVDMARMKAEFMQGWHQENGITLAERFFGQAGALYPLASAFPQITNWLINSLVGKELLEKFLGIHPKRNLPEFANQRFRTWFHGYQKQRANDKVVLLADIFTDYHEPDIGKAAVEILESLGYEVIVPNIAELGRIHLSKGLVALAKQLVYRNIPSLYNYASRGIPIVGLEPSEILTLRDEYLDLCKEEDLDKAELISERTYQFEEFINQSDKKLNYQKKAKVYVHGHCHAKSLVGMDPTLKALKKAGFEPVNLATGCCGMAGSFGYEKEHYKVSMDIGELVLFPSLRELPEDALICAPGFSCRHQIMDGTGRKAFHPAELLAGSK